MKTYKHKKLWWEATEEELFLEEWKSIMYGVKKTGSKQTFYAYPEIIENSQEREEVVEKDWISQCIDEYNTLSRIAYKLDNGRVPTVDLKRIIEQHAPKQKMFTREEVEYLKSYATPNDEYISYYWFIQFLKTHWLLSSDE